MIPKAIFAAANLLLITIAAYFAVDGFYQTATTGLSGPPMSESRSAFPVGDAEAAVKPISAYQAVLDRNLFNTRGEGTSQPTPVDVESLEATTLNLKLWGTVTGTAEGDYAVIEDVKSREQNLYRVGDAIQSATVKEIFREKVILSVNGKNEVLEMEDPSSIKGPVRPAGLPTRQATAGLTGVIRTQRISLRRSYIEQSMTDMATLMSDVQIQPHMEDGVAAGLSLSSIKPNSIFRRMGLRNGDVITGVDGNEISTVDDALKLVDSLKSASSLTVQLKRRGRERNIQYMIR